jgi:hypothetical protein
MNNDTQRYLGPIRSRRDLCRFYTPHAHAERSCDCYQTLRDRLVAWFLRQLFPSGIGFVITLIIGLLLGWSLYAFLVAWLMWCFLEALRIGPEYEQYQRDRRHLNRGRS